MDDLRSQPVVVLLAGPQASGKSTLALGLTDELRRGGESVALVELDQIAAMALPTLPTWTVAHRVFELVVGEWARSTLSCVIAEGSGSKSEVSALRAALPTGAPVVTVAVTASLSTAFARAQQDGSRGVSRQYEYLEAVYQRWPVELARLDADIILDTDSLSVPEAVERLRVALAGTRNR